MAAFVQELFTSRGNYPDSSSRVGQRDRLWYDSESNTFRVSDGVTPGGVVVGGTDGGGDYTLPTASATVKGGVKIDGTTITINNQIISAVQQDLSSYATQSYVTSRGYLTSVGTISYNDLSNKPTIPTALSALSDVNITGTPDNGHVLKYNSALGHWSPAADLTGGGGGGLTLSDLDSAVDDTPSGSGNFTYNDTTGVFTYTPPDLSRYITSQFTFNVAADDSTLITIGSEETVTFIGANGITTASDAEGAVTITLGDTLTWTNPSPAPGTPWRTTINAASGNANIVLHSGLPGFGSSVSWTLDETKLTFPDNTVQTTAFTGSSTVDANDLTGTTLASGVTASSLTSLGSLTGLTVGGTGGDLTMTGGAITGVGNITATGILAVNASGGITTTQTSFDIVNSTATTVNIGGAATAVNIGATTGTLTLNNPTVVGTQTTQAVFDTVATTVTAFRAATTLTIGATSGTLTLRNTTIVGSQSSLTLFNTVATTVNTFGAATTLNIGATTGTTTVNNNLSLASGKTIGTTGTITSNHATAFIAGDNAVSGVALQVPREGAIRNLYNGTGNNMYFDVSMGGASQGQFQFRSSSAYTNILTMSPTAFTVNTDAVVTARTPSFGRTAWNAAIDTELIIDEYRWRVTNSGGIYPQVISNTGGTKNSAWTAVAAISGQAIGQGGSTGTLVPNNAWTNLYTFAAMNSAGDTVTVTLQDKAQGRIYRVTFMRSDDGATTGYNIIVERLL